MSGRKNTAFPALCRVHFPENAVFWQCREDEGCISKESYECTGQDEIAYGCIRKGRGNKEMDLKKIGQFLKCLRKEKGITQEQFAEILGVSGRTVSRWETGANMPDLDILIQIADYYEVEIREILDGERKSGKMNKEMEDTVLKVADYSNHEKQRVARRMCVLFGCGLIAFTVYLVMEYLGIADAKGVREDVASAALGFAYGIMITGVLYTSGCLMKFKAFKRRLRGRE